MERFNIDDVRDTFRSDLVPFLDRIEEAAEALLKALGSKPRGRKHDALFDEVAECAHSIHGSSSLVNAYSLAHTSHLIEALSRAARVAESKGDNEQLRELALAWQRGTACMRKMIELELAHDGAVAVQRTLQFRKELSRWESHLPPIPESGIGITMTAPVSPAAAVDVSYSFFEPMEPAKPSSAQVAAPPVATPPAPPAPVAPIIVPAAEPEKIEDAVEYTFEPAAAAPPPVKPEVPAEIAATKAMHVTPETPATAVTAEMESELTEIFQQEARETLVALEGYLQALARNPSDRSAADNLERIYHTLKGASATIGLLAISEILKEIESLTSDRLEKNEPFTPEMIDFIVEKTNAVLAASKLPLVVLAQPANTTEDDLQGIYRKEAEDTFQQIEAAVQALPSAAPGSAEEASLRATMQTLLHRLQGSATLYADVKLAREAEKLKELCQAAVDLERLFEEMTSGTKTLRLLVGAGDRDVALYDSSIAGVLVSSPDSQAAPAESSASSAALAPSSINTPIREEVELDTDVEVRNAFETECGELTASIDSMLMALDESPQPKHVLAELLRSYHTFKGSVNTMGLSALGKIVHHVEDFLEELLSASILPPMRNLSTYLLRVQDGLRANLKTAERGYVVTSLAQLDADIALLRQGGKPLAEPPKSGVASGSSVWKNDSKNAGGEADQGERGERKSIRVSTERLDQLMNLTGELVVSRARTGRRVTTLRSLQRELSYSRERLLQAIDQFRERNEFSSHSAKAGKTVNFAVRRVSGALPAGPGTVQKSDLQQVFSDLELDRYDDINILARRLNEISNDISELQSQINTTLDSFAEDSDGFGKIVGGLQSEITRARMVPVSQLFARLQRPIRDAAEREGKEIRMVTSEEEVELDKTIVDDLYVPMLHLVRNAVAHGIEPADRRAAIGKDRVGTVTLTARQESGRIILEVSDDGGGLNLKALFQKGLERGAIKADAANDHSAIRDLIFLPGISTRDVAGDVSGRGIGCDVVRGEIGKLNGHIDVTTDAGKGTTFVIALPMTLAIRRALLVKQSGQTYAIPLSFARRSIDLSRAEIVDSVGIKRVNFDGTFFPIQDLREILALPETTEDAEGAAAAPARHALLLTVGDISMAVVVDHVMGQDEIVVKTLGDVLGGHPLFSGITISGDGDLILILDVPGMIESSNDGALSVQRSSSGSASSIVRAKSAEPSAPATQPANAKARVLFIDDSLSVRKVAEKFLRNLGVDFTMAVDGVDGLEKLRQGRFDMIFTDLEMPRMHGYEVIREVRYVPAFKDIPVVVVTSRSGGKHKAQAELAGANDYVTKPFTQEVLQEKVTQWVYQRTASAR